MTRFRHAFLSAIMVAGIALFPMRASATTPPRVVAPVELANKPIEVAITTKHLTLIHFEAGEVSMVAVGDPALVSVTVKGADVLLKALMPSGSTNGFIWQSNRYTQWTFTVRQNGKDARVIIVRDPVASDRDESRRATTGSAKGGKPTTGTTAAATRPQQSPSGSTAPSSATVSSPSEPSVISAQPHPEIAGDDSREACGASASLDHFVKTLNGRQRELFGVFLTEPSLASLQALLVELNGRQRCDLLALLSAPTPSKEPATDILD